MASDAASFASTTAVARLPRWLAALFIVVLVSELVYVFTLPLVDRVRPIPDDSFFFLQVALRFWETGGLFTFDGQAETYGFQPLWQLLLIAIAPIFSTAQSLFAAALTLCCVLHVATGWRLYHFGERAFGRACGTLAALLWTCNPAIMVWCWGLKENALYAFFLVIATAQLLRLLQRGVAGRATVAFGLVLGLMVLTRINALIAAGILLAVFVVACGGAGGLKARLRGALLAGAIGALVGAPWYVYAYAHFGSALPTSGTWKLLVMKGHVLGQWQAAWLSPEHFARALREWPGYLGFLFGHGYGLFRPLMLAISGLGGLLALVRGVRHGGRGHGPALWVVSGLVVVALAASFANQLVLPSYLGYADWYAVPEFVALAVLAGAFAVPIVRLRPRWVGFGLLVVTVAGAWWLLPPQRGLLQRHERGLLAAPPGITQLLEMGLWARRHLPDDQAVGIWDPGIVSYFAGKRFVSFDPLMNSLEYQQRSILDPVSYVQRREIAYMFGVVHRIGDRWQYDPLPAGSFEIVWLPFPDHDVGFEQKRALHYALVRPLASPAPAFLAPADFPCGELYPNDPARRRRITRDRDRLVAGDAVAADALRLWLDVPEGGPDLELRVAGAPYRTFPAGTKRYESLDVSASRGARLELVYPGREASSAVTEAHIVDFDW